MDILIRKVSEEDADTLTLKAKAAGAEDRGAWLAEQLHKLAVMPEYYGFRIHGQVGRGMIKRYSNHLNGTSSTFSNFNQDESVAVGMATDYIRRNGPGDRERAYGLLISQFGEDNVFEIPV